MKMVVCKDCGVAQPVVNFRKDARLTAGHRADCNSCRSARRRARYAENPAPILESGRRSREKHRDKKLARDADYRKTKPEIVAAAKARWHQENKDYVRERAKEWRTKNREELAEKKRQYKARQDQEEIKAWYRKYRKENREKFAHFAPARRAKLAERMPPWVNPTELRAVYRKAGELRKLGLGMHVDHIVPLRGRTVSGLHVPWNLDIIPSEDNVRKSAKFDPARGFAVDPYAVAAAMKISR